MLPATLLARKEAEENCQLPLPAPAIEPDQAWAEEISPTRIGDAWTGRSLSVVPGAPAAQKPQHSEPIGNGKPHARPPPVCIACITVLEVGIFIYTVVFNEGVEPLSVNYMIGPGAQTLHLCGGLYLFRGEYWRLFTAVFLHAGLLHLVSNLLIQWWIGKAIEAAWGAQGTARIYILCGLSGSLLSATLSKVNSVSVGASGAIHGLMAIGVTGEAGELGWPSFLRSAAEHFGSWFGWKAIALALALSLISGLVFTNVDSWAHVGGTVAGFALAAVRRRGRGSWRLLARGFAAIVGLAHTAACIYLLFFCSSCFEPPGQVAQVLI